MFTQTSRVILNVVKDLAKSLIKSQREIAFSPLLFPSASDLKVRAANTFLRVAQNDSIAVFYKNRKTPILLPKFIVGRKAYEAFKVRLRLFFSDLIGYCEWFFQPISLHLFFFLLRHEFSWITSGTHLIDALQEDNDHAAIVFCEIIFIFAELVNKYSINK